MRTALRRLAIGSLLLVLTMPLGARSRPHYGGTLRMELSEANWLDNDAARMLVLDTLTSIDASGEVAPWLATQWQEQNGARRWRLTLRSRIAWHDGAPLTAESAATSLRAHIPGTELDGSTVRAEGDAIVIENTRPIALLPALLALPRFALVRVEQGQVLGTGAFQFSRVETANQVELTANEACWHGRPYLDGITITAGRSMREQWMDAAVKSTDVAALPAELLRRAQQERLRPVASANDELIALQATAAGITLDVRLRQALAATVDRTVLLSFVFQKQGEVAAGVLPNWLTGYAALFPATPDAARSHELRMQAGQSRAVVIGYPPEDASLQLVAERIALTARDSGIQAQASATSAADFEVRRICLPLPEPQVALTAFAASVQTPIAIASDESEELFRNERELLMQANLIPLLYVPRVYAVAERVHGASVDSAGRLDLSNAWIEERR